MDFDRCAISIAATAQSTPLLPDLVPARSIACSIVSVGLQGLSDVHYRVGPEIPLRQSE